MSAASIDPQTSKGQDASKAFPVSVQNGSLHQKDTVHDNDFEPYLTNQSNQNNSYQSMTDPYLSSYYAPSIGFPFPLSEAPWSTGGDPPIPYLTPYAPLSNGDHHFLHDTVFGQPGGLGSSIYPPHRFNFFPENPGFSAWGTSGGGSQGQQTQSSAYGGGGGSYSYPPSSLGGTLVPPSSLGGTLVAPDGQTGFHNDNLSNKAPGMNSLEQGMLGLKIGGGGGGDGGVKSVGSLGGGVVTGNGGTPIGLPPPKIASWAAIASKPAKMQQQQKMMRNNKPPLMAGLPPPQTLKNHNMDISLVQQMTMQGPPPPQSYQNHGSTPPTRWVAPRSRNLCYGGGSLDSSGSSNGGTGGGGLPPDSGLDSHPVLEKLRASNAYNPQEFDCSLKHGRVFIIKSY
ncbi:hypothetical protein KUCAC02_036469, partial [Chaenocephalus aceratus]